MLPDFLHSSYLIYKENTALVATWLAEKAKQRGFSADLLCNQAAKQSQPKPSGRLKGKARKEAKKEAGGVGTGESQEASSEVQRLVYTIAIKDYITLADYVAAADNPAVKVPVDVGNALRKAIELRRLHYNAASQSESRSLIESAADAGHLHFLGVLEKTQEILRPRMLPDLLCEDATSKHDPLKNKFEGLTVQEPSQAFIDAPDVKPDLYSVSKETPQYQPEPIRELQEELLATHCFLEDIFNVRSFVKQMWQSVLQGVDIAAASIAINTAIDFVRQLEADFLSSYPDKKNFEDIVTMWYGAQCIGRGQNPAARQLPSDLINFAIYDFAEDVMMPTYIVLDGFSDVIDHGRPLISKPGHFGVRDSSKRWSEMSDRAKFQDDKIVATEALSDLWLLSISAEKAPLVEDELLRGIRKMGPGKPISLWLVFAMQCFLDAQHIRGDSLQRPFIELKNVSLLMKASIAQNLKFHSSLRIENWNRTNDLILEAQISDIETWVEKDLVGEKIMKIQVSNRDVEISTNRYTDLSTKSTQPVQLPPPEPFRLLKQYPLLCGLFQYVIKMRFHEAGVTFANAWGSIMYTAHLYNAVQQEKLLDLAWKDMDLLIALQSPQTVFIGDPPEGPEKYLNRFILCMGWSATNLAKNSRRNQKLKASPNGPKGLDEQGPASYVFKTRYCDNARDFKWSTDAVQPILNAKMDEDSDEEGPDDTKPANGRGSEKNKKKKTKTAASGVLIQKNKTETTQNNSPMLDFFQDILNALHAEKLEMTMDYFMLHRFCWLLLRRVNEACKPQLQSMFRVGYLERENQLPYVVGYILMAATNTSNVANLFPKRDGIGVTSRLLATAAHQLREMIEAKGPGVGAGEMVVQRLQQLGVPIDFGSGERE